MIAADVATAPLAVAKAMGADDVCQIGVDGLPADVEVVIEASGALVTREITWVGSYRFVDEITDAVRALADGLDVEPLITHEFGIAAATEAFAAAAAPNSSKVLLKLAKP